MISLGHADNGQRPSSSLSNDASVPASRPSSTPASSSVSSEAKSEVLATTLCTIQEDRRWTTKGPGEGVFVRRNRLEYVACPESLTNDGSHFCQMVGLLNFKIAMTINNRVTQFLLRHAATNYIQICEGLRLQVVPDLQALPYCQKRQCAAFVTSKQYLVVWEDQADRLLERATYLQETLYDMMIKFEGPHPSLELLSPDDISYKWEGLHEEDAVSNARPVAILQAFLTALTLIGVCTAIGSGWRQVAIEIATDGGWIRLAFTACILPQLWLALFFFQAMVGNVAQMIGPTGQVSKNTKFYSGQPPARLCRKTLPHVTIQLPVYKEGLKAVIDPTIRSLKAAIATYEMQGGTANIFINDDGMQVLDDSQALERQQYYDDNDIGWVARPSHNPDGQNQQRHIFNRRGKFKKASNMNYAMWVSTTIEAALENIERGESWNQLDENAVYVEAFRKFLLDQKGRAWGNGNIRIGDYILLVDSDTRVPQDCLLEAVSEMEQSPSVAIIQYLSGVMNVTDNFFERGITFFTNLIYTQIQFAVANGDVAPFVGHNAVLRWSAIQEIGYHCEFDDCEKYWSEETVSEDFDMALRLQASGYIVRLGAYQGKGFKEGVSLSVYDELNRWEKYAYGCNELIFNPFKLWFTRGPFNKLFIRFITSGMPLASKLTIIAYIGTYYALGSAWIFTFANYFLTGWFNGWLDHYYLESFKVYFSIIVVFTASGNLSLAIFRYRIKEGSLLDNLWENLKWIPLLVIFLGGVSLHVSQALLSHFFGINMTWGATAKEMEHVPFFQEIPRVIRRFRGTFTFCIFTTAMMIYLGVGAPHWWRISFFTPIWPLTCVVVSHFLLPIVLNPNLMLFRW